MDFIKKCDKCQRFSNLHHAPVEDLHSTFSPCPFNKWSTSILGPFFIAPGQVKFLIIILDYFTKWVEVESVASITAAKVKKFYWKIIICRFDMPTEIVSDNGTQFKSYKVTDFYKELGIENIFISVKHPQANGQAESANKVILSNLKKKLDASKGLWAESLCEFLWSYHTTLHSSTGEPSFRLTFGADAMIPVELGEPSHGRVEIIGTNKHG